MYRSIIFSTDGAIATIKLNRPEKLNAFGGPMREELLDAAGVVAADSNIRALVVTGEGRGFSAGGDIDFLKKVREEKDEQSFRSLLSAGQKITRMFRTMWKPVIAAVNGPCAGAGFSFALGCDIRIASEKATFGASFARIGLHPDWGASWFLPRLVGTAQACELIFTGAMITAQQAEKIGLVNRVVPHDDLMSTVMDLARKMANNSPNVIRLAKESIYRSLTSGLETAFVRESDVQTECFYSEDFLEGLKAFSEKGILNSRAVDMKFRFLLLMTLFIAGCSQNMEVVNSGERLEDSPKPVADTNSAPLARPGAAAGTDTTQIPPFVKAYFMHMWVEALYSPPQNKHPNPNWQSPLKDPENGRVWCTDCHLSKDIDFSKIPKMRNPMVDGLEKDKDFMAGLMKKWVARLNSDEFGAKAKLKGPVTCLTCHATNPETAN